MLSVSPLPDDAWHNTGLTYRVRAVDEGPLATGVSVVTYRLTGANVGSGQLDRVAGGDIWIGGDGITRVEVEAVDGNGNSAYADFQVRIDRAVPVVVYEGLKPGVTIPLGGDARWDYSCADATGPGVSGLAECTGDLPSGSVLPATTVGDFSLAVRARDKAGNTIVSPFVYHVVDGLRATAPPKITGTPSLGSVLTGTPAEFSPAPDTTGCQWLRDGAPIPGATAHLRTVEQDDLGHNLALRCTAQRAGFPGASATSEPLPVPLAPMPDVVADVAVSGEGRVGQTLTAGYQRRPSLAASAPTLTVRWTRDGVEIPGATGTTYAVSAADQGHRLSAFVRAEWEGYVTTDFPAANGIDVAPAPGGGPGKPGGPTTDQGDRASASVTARGKALSHRRVRLRIRVVAGPLPADGEVVVRRGRAVVATGYVRAGRIVLTLRRQPVGKARYRVRYLGSASVAPAETVLRVRVR
ncbi:hypothetical protein GCM10022263_12500 [Nocardioides daeguensis]|uniref:Ig-like domain-containing protein n=1 Tax=Nocardioides daeguensis TaxID=908359 RepID=A0ABP6V1S4_9ACTN